MIITKSYLLAHRTKSGGWTKAQFELLGLSFPPVTGWMALVRGREITDDEAARFEQAKHESKDAGLPHIKYLIRKLTNEQIAHLQRWITRL